MLIKSVVAILLFVSLGCASPKTLFEPIILAAEDVPFSLADKTPTKVPKRVGSEVEKFEVFSEDDSMAIFKTLCRGGKPARKVEHQLKYVLPFPPKGIPLSKANTFIESHQALMRAEVANFYYWLMFMGRSKHGEPLFMVSSLEESAVVAGLSRRTLKEVSNLRVEQLQHFPPVIIKTADDKLVMSVVDKKEYFGHIKDTNGRIVSGFYQPPAGFNGRIPLELFSIGRHFVILASKEERRPWKKVYQARSKGQIASLEDEGEIVPGEILSHDILLKSREDIWREYLVSNTDIRESNTDDGAIFAFNLKLNTEPMCRSGRPINDLKSN